MAITVTTILGTDSLTASRPIINDNFNILKDEINAIEAYIDPDAGTISGLVSLQTGELRVGPIGNYYMEITPSVFNINRPTVFTSSGLVEFTGLVANNSFTVIDTTVTLTYTIDPTTGYTNYSVKHTAGGTSTISVNDGYYGQEITIFCEQITSGSIDIVASGTADFVFGATYAPNATVTLDEEGSNITLRCMVDSSGNQAWYAVSYHNVTFS